MSVQPVQSRSAAFICGVAIAATLAVTAPARAQDTATAITTGSTSISAPQALSVTQNLAFTITPASLNTGLIITSSSVSGLNANFSLTGAQTASIAVPASFNVTRLGGTDSVTVRTVAPTGDVTGGTQVSGLSNGTGFSQPVTVVGNLDSGAMSFSIGGAVTASNDLKPGEYHGVLTVVAQFN